MGEEQEAGGSEAAVSAGDDGETLGEFVVKDSLRTMVTFET